METNTDFTLYQPLSIVIIGPSQVGKSTFINRLFGSDVASTGSDGQSCTQSVKRYVKLSPSHNNVMYVTDTPGVSDSSRSDEQICAEIIEELSKFKAGKKKYIFLFQKFTDSETGVAQGPVKLAQEICKYYKDKNVSFEIILVFTFTIITQWSTYPKDWLEKVGAEIKRKQPTIDDKKLKESVWEELLQRKLKYFNEKFNSRQLLYIVSDFGTGDSMFQDPLPPHHEVDREVIFKFFKENFPFMIPQLQGGTDPVISTMARNHMHIAGAGAGGVVGGIFGGFFGATALTALAGMEISAGITALASSVALLNPVGLAVGAGMLGVFALASIGAVCRNLISDGSNVSNPLFLVYGKHFCFGKKHTLALRTDLEPAAMEKSRVLWSVIVVKGKTYVYLANIINDKQCEYLTFKNKTLSWEKAPETALYYIIESNALIFYATFIDTEKKEEKYYLVADEKSNVVQFLKDVPPTSWILMLADG